MKQAIDELKRLRSILSGITGFEDDDQEYIEDARKSVDRIIEALAEQPAPVQGWKLVPVEPTPEQIKEGNKVTWPLPCAQVYSAMLAAAPQPAPPPQRKPLTAEQEVEEFEAWCYSVGLMQKSHGIVSISSQSDIAWKAWQARAAHGIKGEA